MDRPDGDVRVRFGHWVAGEEWSELSADYNVAEGRLWSLVRVHGRSAIARAGG